MSVQKENFSKNVTQKKKKKLLLSVYKDCFYRSHPYFNKDPSIEYAQSPVGIRYYNTFGGRYIKECDLDPTLPKNDRGGSINENVSGLTILLDFRANLWVASGQYRAAEIPPYIVAAILQSELTPQCISRHINESARDPGTSTATVDSDAARITEFNRGNLQHMDVLTECTQVELIMQVYLRFSMLRR
jgi:hypothetical protein